MPLPIKPPIEPMLARLSTAIPADDGGGDRWLYEPKWDGFRCIVFFDGKAAYLQSRDLKPLQRYFPELQESLQRTLPHPMVLDGEVVVMTDHGLDWEALSQRIHPAESRVRKLAAETPSSFVAFDMLADTSTNLMQAPFHERRDCLVASLAGAVAPVFVTPATHDRATALDWFERFEGAGLDGVVAKRLAELYLPGTRAMLKIKHLRTADCVVAGLRWYKNETEKAVGSLLLGLYDERGVLHHVGHTSSFKAEEKRALAQEMRAHITDDENEGFGAGRTPGGPSRWTQGKDMTWVRLRPELVCEVTFDYLQGTRFRHAATFVRWRPDKAPRDCGFDQIETTVPFELQAIFAGT